ncbi:phenylacetate--CoA ligase family protein [Cellulomonas sp. Sa3CUA2]|uniref:Phenylacetate--CoA ligase family protein n=1 Tax=Cellulomonas avistercoris TaxID=2762242 RepID=A0ABR8QB11_9CELL|nr:phenylacetate--CoA ligase family protein [Cellulomonas avistercoris]MBD7917595.1 phenylacetate--CoA ligase family protein [Cellulomonas avistercoris]
MTTDRRDPLARPGPSPRTSALRQAALRIATWGVTTVYRAYRLHPALWRFTARNYHPAMERFARLNAWMICQHAYLDVPAYRHYVDEAGFRFRWWDLTAYRPTSKHEYVDRYPEDVRCWDGFIETVGTVVDESSGSSGTPYNWMRSRRELATVHKNVAGYVTSLFGTRRLFAVNAFSMGAWATGTNTGIAMSRIAMVKNTGPDIDKIVDTLRHFGPRYTYLVCAYPPFLKHLRDRLDADGFDWDAYDLNGFVGGEALTEGLRDYLEDRFGRVYSGYGASDLTIGMAGESDLAVWVRRTLAAGGPLRDALLGPDETRTPMVFQYNPLETYMETTADRHLLVTLNSADIMSPKLRYDIGDEAQIVTFDAMKAAIAALPEPQRHRLAFGFERAYAIQRMRLPFLLLYGRKDSTVSYMGANLYPLDVENGLYLDNPHAAVIESFKLALVDVGDHEQRPAIHLQLRADADVTADDRTDLAERAAAGVLAHLASVSRDVAQSLEEDPTSGDLRVHVHDHGTGPFAGGSSKIKNVYLVDAGDRDPSTTHPGRTA